MPRCDGSCKNLSLYRLACGKLGSYTNKLDTEEKEVREYPDDNINPGFRLERKDYSRYDYYVQSLLTRLDI